MLLVALTFREVAEAPDLLIRLEWLKLMILTVPIVGANFFYYKEARFGEAAGKSTKYRKLLEKKRIPHRNRSKKFLKKNVVFLSF